MRVTPYLSLVNKAELLRDQIDELAYELHDLRNKQGDLDERLVEIEDTLAELEVEELFKQPEAVTA